jgi:lipopolysaccharide exporter
MSASVIASAGPDSLGRRGAVALGWSVMVSALKIVVTLGVQAALARLLGPIQFGIFAIGMLVVGLAGMFADIGLATGLVQKEVVGDEDVRFVFSMNLAISSAVALIIFAFAPALAAGFRKPEVAGVFRALAPAFVLNAITSVSVSLLRRSLDYRTIQLAGIAGYIVGFALIGVPLAWVTGSVYAVVAAFVTQSVVTLGLLYAKTRHVVGLRFKAPAQREHLAFGGTVLVTNLVNWAVSSIDRLIIGRLFSSAQLGLYSAAYNLVYAPVGLLYPNLQSVVFSTTARLQGKADRLHAVYLDLLQSVVFFVFPPFAGLFFLAQPLVLAVYGTRWAGSGALASVFALMAPFLLVWAISTPLLWNSGKKSLEAKAQLPFIVVAIGGLTLAARTSLLAVGWTAAALYIGRTLLIVTLVLRTLRVHPMEVARRLAPGAMTSIAVGVLAWVCDTLLVRQSAPVPLRLVAGFMVIGVTQLGILLLVPSMLPVSVQRTIGRQSAGRGVVLRALFARLAAESQP